MIFVTGLPRSRTYWFSRYFSACGAPCHHEHLAAVKSRNEFYAEMESGAGDSDHMLYITDYETRWPDARRLIIRRPLGEVMRSLMAIGIRPSLPQLMQNLDGINSVTGLHVRYCDINKSLRAIHEYMVPNIPFSQDLADRMIASKLESVKRDADPSCLDIWRI